MATTPTPDASGDWWLDKSNGHIWHSSNLLQKIYDEGQQQAFNNPISFATKTDAEEFWAAYQAHKQNPNAPSPDKTWWYNPEDCSVFHGTEGEMNSPWIAYATQAEADAAAKSCNAVGTSLKDAAGTIGAGVFGPLFQKSLWLRVVEVGIGIALLIVGIVKLAPPSLIQATPIGKVASAL